MLTTQCHCYVSQSGAQVWVIGLYLDHVSVLTVGPLDVHVHPHPDAAHHGLHVVRHLHLLAAAGLSGLNLDLTSLWSRLTNPHLSHSLTLSSLTSFKTGPLTARCKELTH